MNKAEWESEYQRISNQIVRLREQKSAVLEEYERLCDTLALKIRELANHYTTHRTKE